MVKMHPRSCCCQSYMHARFLQVCTLLPSIDYHINQAWASGLFANHLDSPAGDLSDGYGSPCEQSQGIAAWVYYFI